MSSFDICSIKYSMTKSIKLDKFLSELYKNMIKVVNILKHLILILMKMIR